jgi:PAS domain S-box-containing protein
MTSGSEGRWMPVDHKSRQGVLDDPAGPAAKPEQPPARFESEALILYRLSDQLARAGSLDEVYAAGLDAILAALHCERASILLFDPAGVMRFVAWRGLSDTYRTTLEGHSPWKPGERSAQPIFVADIDATDEPEWVKSAVRNEGIRSLGFIPLLAGGAVIGKFMTYYDARHTLVEHERHLALTIARHIGFSIERSRTEEARRRAQEELRESEERFRLMSEHAPVMIWISDKTGRCLHLNRMLREFWGVDEDKVAEFDWSDTMHPEDAPEIGRRVMDALAAESGFTVKGRYRTADGSLRVLQTDARPRRSADGEFLGMIGVNVDVTDRENTEDALRRSEEQFRLAVEAAPSGMVMADAAGLIVMVNSHAETLFGYSRDELIGRSIESLVPERFRAGHPRFRTAYAGEPSARPMGAGRDLFALHRDGSEIPVEIGLSPLLTSKGVMTLAAVVDISARKRAEAQRELLIAELNHRVKNTLAVIQSIAHQTFKGGRAVPEAKAAFESRLVALAGAHDLLTRSNWDSASLRELATSCLHSHAAHTARIALDGPDVLLPPRQALALALALNELYTNAIKYGALSNDSGRVALTWSRAGTPAILDLVWQEHGGPAVVPPTHQGFGSVLLERMLGEDLHGQVARDFRPEGLVCSIAAPIGTAAEHSTRQRWDGGD